MQTAIVARLMAMIHQTGWARLWTGWMALMRVVLAKAKKTKKTKSTIPDCDSL
jgi:hypothetical protein